MPKFTRFLLIAFLCPLFLQAQTKAKILIVPPQSVALNKHSVAAMRSNNIKPDSLVIVARQVFVKNAQGLLSDYVVRVFGTGDTTKMRPVPVTRTATIKVKKRNFITKKERLQNKKVKYKGVTIGPDEKLRLEVERKAFDYDYVVFISLFEIADNKSFNFAMKSLSRFAVHYEIYDKNLVFKTGNIIADDFVVSPGMSPSVLFHYLNLSAQNVYLAVGTGLN